MDLEEVAKGPDDVMRVIELVVLHAVSEEHVRLAFGEPIGHHLDRVLVGNHGVLDPVEDGRRASYLLYSFKIVESFIDDQVDYASVLLPGDIFNRLDRADQDEASRVEQASQVASRSRADGPTAEYDVLLFD